MRSRLEPELSKNDPVFDHLISALRVGQPIAYSKINHGFWERLVALERDGGFDLLENDPKRLKEMDDFIRKIYYFVQWLMNLIMI